MKKMQKKCRNFTQIAPENWRLGVAKCAAGKISAKTFFLTWKMQNELDF